MTRRKCTTIKSGMPMWNGERIGEIIDITPLRYPLTYNLQDRANILPMTAPITNICAICGQPIRWGDSMNYRDMTCVKHFWTHYPILARPNPFVVERIDLPQRGSFSAGIWQLIRETVFRLLTFRWWVQQRRGGQL